MRIQDYCDVIDGALQLKYPLQQFNHNGIITDSSEMKSQLDILQRASKTDSPLTILGGKGSGKGVLAQYAHNLSGKCRGPFLKINCGYLPEARMELELFGTALNKDMSLLSRAIGGTLYIENADLLPQFTQCKLMDYIQSSPANTRFIISLQSPEKMDARLTDQMLFHFTTIAIEIPLLRQRPEDILLLTFSQLKKIEEDYRIIRKISPEVMSAMLTSEWPSNTRQLTQAVERMAFVSNKTLLDSVALFRRCLSVNRQTQPSNHNVPTLPASKSLKQLLQDYEIMIINQYVEQYGSLRKAAAALQTSPATLSRRITEYNLLPQGEPKDV